MRSGFLKAAVISLMSVFLVSGYGHAGFLDSPGGGNRHGKLFSLKPDIHGFANISGRHAPDLPDRYKEGEILVKFKPSATEQAKKNLHKKHGSEKIKEFPSLRLHHVKLRNGVSVDDAVKLYKAEPDVEYAEPDFFRKVMATPNDPSYSSLWGMAKIYAPAAWNSTTGSGSVVVAVIDTGIDYSHPDLAANAWTNGAEIAHNGIDDDHNGYVDDVHGINVITNSGDPMDDHGHGTHVAGTIGAIGNNGIGVVGVNWNIRIIGCKFVGADGYGTDDGAIACLQYVRRLKDSGVNIVATNNSWGGGGYSQALYDTIAAQGDILFIAAAGNNSSDNGQYEFYPANYTLPDLLSVAATDSADNMAYFSNFGRRNVHVGAPGLNIFSTLPAQNAFNITGGYGSLSGTSMATPHVAGLAALIKAQKPTRDWKEIKNLILAGGDGISSMEGVTVTGRRTNANSSLNCTNSPVFSILQAPTSLTPDKQETLSVLSINCDSPAGPISASTSSGGSITFHDDGVSPDAVAGDGIFTAVWIPAALTEKLTVSSPAGSETVAIPGLKIVSPDPIEASVFTTYSHAFVAAGGMAPYSWSLVSGELPAGFSFDSATGRITGTPEKTETSAFTIQVRDSWGFTATKSLSITIDDQLALAVWTRIYDSGNRDSGDDVAVDPAGNIYVTGYTGVTDGWWAGAYSFLTRKYDPAGNLLWSVTRPTPVSMFWIGTHKIAADRNGNVYMAGMNGGNYLLVKYDSSGNEQWARTYSDGNNNITTGVAVDPDGNVYVTGQSDTSTGSISLTVKYDSAGNVQWTRTSPGAGGARGISTDSSGNIYVIDYFGSYGLRVTKHNSSGDTLWSRTYPTPTLYWVVGVAADPEGNVYLAGHYDEPAGAGGWFTVSSIVIKYDLQGNLLWTKTISGEATGIATDKYGHAYLLAGYCYKLDRSNGDILWKKSFGWDGYGVAADTRGNVYLAGEAWNGHNYDFKTKKYNDYFILTPAATYLVLGQLFRQQLTVTGGDAPYTWSVTAGALPQGLSLDAATGEISGTATQLGVFSFTIEASDRMATVVAKDFSYTVTWITTPSLPAGPTNIAYDQFLAATGGFPPYTWVVSSGTLPPGVTLNTSTGKLSGTPTTPGRYVFTIQATDSRGATSIRTFTIVVFSSLSIYDSGGHENVYGLVVDGTGNYYLAGDGGTGTHCAAFSAKYDPMGKLVWSQTQQEPWYCAGPATAALDTYDNLLVAGGIRGGQTAKAFDMIVYKYDHKGNLIWKSQVIQNSVTTPRDMKLDASGNLYVAGDRITKVAEYTERSTFLVTKLDQSGNVLWEKTYGDLTFDSHASAIALDASGNIYVTGWNAGETGNGRSSIVTIKYDPSGNFLWKKAYTELNSDCYSGGLAIDGSDRIYMGGYCMGSGGVVASYASLGAVLWTKSMPGVSFESAAVDARNTLYLAGSSFNGTDNDFRTMRLDSAGNVIWDKTYDDGRSESASRVTVDGSGVVYVAGITYLYNPSDYAHSQDILTVRYYPPVLVTPALLSGTIGSPYSQSLSARSGITPYSWSVSGGLPPGITLDQATGVLSGIPTAVGSFTFTVKVSDSNSLADLRTFSLTIQNQPPVPAFTGTPLTGQAPLYVSFIDNSTNIPLSWSWTFGDGGASNSRNPSHLYTTPGTYTVILSAANSAGSNTMIRQDYVTVCACLNALSGSPGPFPLCTPPSRWRMARRRTMISYSCRPWISLMI